MENARGIQHQIRENARTIQSYVSDLKEWASDMKAVELSESPADSKSLKTVPPRSKGKGKGKSSPSDRGDASSEQNEVDENKKIKGYNIDYEAWSKYDANKDLKLLEKSENKVLDDDEKVREKALKIRMKKEAEELKDKGNEELKQGNYEKAVLFYTQGIEKDATNWALFANRAQAHIKLQGFRKAIKDCTRCLQLNPNFVKAFFRRGKARMQLGFFTEAKEDLDVALKLQKNNVEVKRLLQDLSVQLKYQRDTQKTQNGMISCNPKALNMDYGSENVIIPLKESYPNNETYPKLILPVQKPLNKRSKRPLMPVFIKTIRGSGKEDDNKGKELKELKEGEKRMRISVPESTLDGTVKVETRSAESFKISEKNSTQSPKDTTVLPELFSQLNVMNLPPKPTTASQFFNAWKKLKASQDLACKYLQQMEAKDYRIFQEMMEISLMSEIIEILVWEFIPKGLDVTVHLKGLSNLKRLSTLVLFFTERDRANLRKLVSACQPSLQNELSACFGI